MHLSWTGSGFLSIRIVLSDGIINILKVPMPDVKLLTQPPGFHIRSRFQPCCNPIHSGIRIVGATAKLNYYVQFIFFTATATVASI